MFKQFFYKLRLKKLLASTTDQFDLCVLLANELSEVSRINVVYPSITINNRISIVTKYRDAQALIDDLGRITESVLGLSYLTDLKAPTGAFKTQLIYDWCQTPEGYDIDLVAFLDHVRSQLTAIGDTLNQYTKSETAHKREYVVYIRRKGTHVFETTLRLLKICIAIEKDQMWLLNQ